MLFKGTRQECMRVAAQTRTLVFISPGVPVHYQKIFWLNVIKFLLFCHGFMFDSQIIQADSKTLH